MNFDQQDEKKTWNQKKSDVLNELIKNGEEYRKRILNSDMGKKLITPFNT